jgi:hypothetical protein
MLRMRFYLIRLQVSLSVRPNTKFLARPGVTILVRGAAVLIALFATYTWLALQHIDDAVGTPPGHLLLEAIVPFVLLSLSQLGLFLAPNMRARSLRPRLIVGLLMAPSTAFLLAAAIEHLREITAYGPGWLLRMDGLWIPILAVYVWQYASLLSPSALAGLPSMRSRPNDRCS